MTRTETATAPRFSHTDAEPHRQQAVKSDEVELWLATITTDADASDQGPATAGNRIECREGCGW